MPRIEINIADKVEYLSILDEKGTLDTDLEPEIPEDPDGEPIGQPFGLLMAIVFELALGLAAVGIGWLIRISMILNSRASNSNREIDGRDKFTFSAISCWDRPSL